MKMVVLTMPVNVLGNEVKVVEDVKTVWDQVDEERRKLPETVEKAREVGGSNGVEAYEKTVNELNQRKQAATDEGIERLQDLEKQYQKAIDDQTVPRGADVSGENESDFRLLENGLVTDAEKLEKLIEAHDNPAFRAMASGYAQKRGWSGFDYVDLERSLRQFGTDFSEACVRGCQNPYGYHSLLVRDGNELSRRALAYGLSSEYDKGAKV